ncbi:MAG: diversity-generating retroelement protein Avd [Planctomycetaceae bacterium]|nr:MAG: diversity-generating retroelement protein Avd [Planctomycetaceae bacterium]
MKVISDFYDFMLWLIQRIEKFPRHHRYSLGMTMENRLHEILAHLLEARYSREKKALLRQANLDLEIVRYQSRLAKDLKALPIKSHGSASRMLAEIGAQVGGWLKSQGGRT